MNARLQILLIIINDVVILIKEINTLLFINIFILLFIGVISLNILLTDIKKRLKYIILYLKKFISKDELIYFIFHGLFKVIL